MSVLHYLGCLPVLRDSRSSGAPAQRRARPSGALRPPRIRIRTHILLSSSPPPEAGGARCVAGARLYEALRRRCAGPMAAPGMAEPRSKRPRVTLPACPAHRPLPASRVRHGFPPAVEEALCGLTAAQLELHYCLQALVRREGTEGCGCPGRRGAQEGLESGRDTGTAVPVS